MSIVGIFIWKNGIHQPVPREIIIQNKPVTYDTINAETNFSAITEPVIDSDGRLNIPDNTTVSDVSTNKICTGLCNFTIPNSWVNNVVIRVIKFNQEDKSLYERPILDTEVIQFYERNTYEKYQTTDYVYTEGASRMGKMTELYITNNNKNEIKDKLDDAQQLYAANESIRNNTYSIFLYQMMDDSIIDSEYAKEYDYLIHSEYIPCIISSITQDNDAKVANSYIKTQYVDNYTDDYSGKMPADYEIVKKNVQKKAKHTETPLLSTDFLPSYQWAGFSSPWFYQDHGTGYPYAPSESGGAVPTSAPTPVPDLDLDNPTTAAVVPEDNEDDVMVVEPDIDEPIYNPEDNYDEEEYYDDYDEDETDENVYVYDGTGEAPEMPYDGEVLDMTGGE